MSRDASGGLDRDGSALCRWPVIMQPNLDLPFWALPLAWVALGTVPSTTLLAKAFGLPIYEGVPRLRGVMDDEKDRVALRRTDYMERHGSFSGHGCGGLVGATAHHPTR